MDSHDYITLFNQKFVIDYVGCQKYMLNKSGAFDESCLNQVKVWEEQNQEACIDESCG